MRLYKAFFRVIIINVVLLHMSKGLFMTGKVKMFNKEKGWGFITGEDGKDYFFHYSALVMDGYKTANAGDNVEYEVTNSERGLRASSVKVVEPVEVKNA